MVKNMEKRFEMIYNDGFFGNNKIIVDKVTGVCYLWHAEGYAGGLTPLLDSDGKPVIDKSFTEEK